MIEICCRQDYRQWRIQECAPRGAMSDPGEVGGGVVGMGLGRGFPSPGNGVPGVTPDGKIVDN